MRVLMRVLTRCDMIDSELLVRDLVRGHSSALDKYGFDHDKHTIQ